MSWFNKLIGSTSGNVAEVNSDKAQVVVDIAPAGASYTTAAKTTTIAAAAAAGAAVFAMRLNPGSTKKVYITAMKLKYTTIVAYTVPITQTRSLVLTRGAGAAASGGTSLATAVKKDTAYSASQTDVATGGDVRISTTAALAVTGITWETQNFAELTLSHVGAAGAFYEHIFEFDSRAHAVELNAGEVLGIRVGASAMDAAGTWSLGVEVSWREGTSDYEA
jgi:hypothetical protein